MTEIETFQTTTSEFEMVYQNLIAVAEKLPESAQTTAGVCGTWSAREVLAHLAGWVVEALRRYPRYAIGTGEIQYNTDAFNAVSVWSRDGKLYDEILDEVRDGSTKLVTFARGLSEAEIQRNGQRYAEWLTRLASDAREHTQQLQEATS